MDSPFSWSIVSFVLKHEIDADDEVWKQIINSISVKIQIPLPGKRLETKKQYGIRPFPVEQQTDDDDDSDDDKNNEQGNSDADDQHFIWYKQH